MERVSCDVLVVGTGAAGLRAAAAVSGRGLKVCAVSKGKAGKGSCTGFSGWVMAGTPQGGSLEAHFDKILLASRGLNDVDLVLEAARKRCESRGAHFREDFPDQDDRCWRGHLMARLDPQGEIHWDFEPFSAPSP